MTIQNTESSLPAQVPPHAGLSFTEENYLKCIYTLSQKEETVSTRLIAKEMDSRDSSVTDMLKRLSAKGTINYIKYKGVSLSESGYATALHIIRKHRLWEVFLVSKLKFKWDEVHEIAEQLEHIKSSRLVDRLDEFLDFPRFDPHGDPIPDKDGNMPNYTQFPLQNAPQDQWLELTRVTNDSQEFLRYLEQTHLLIGSRFKIKQFIEFDESFMLELSDNSSLHISQKVAQHILVRITD
ncbi:MAG: metal-dependent transcriptional regulator [Bacteroidota bacterium]